MAAQGESLFPHFIRLPKRVGRQLSQAVPDTDWPAVIVQCFSLEEESLRGR